MDLNDITSLEQLFSVWKQAHHNESEESYNSYKNGEDNDIAICKDTFFFDGIICEEKYREKQAQGRSILFIGKEAHEFSKDGSKGSTDTFWLQNVVLGTEKSGRLSNGLSILSNAYYSNNYSTPNKDHSILQTVAFMNLNKRGGYANCDQNTLEGYVAHYKDYIYKEINLINPNIIICCGKGLRDLIIRHIPFTNTNNIFAVSHPSRPYISHKRRLQELETCIKTMSTNHQ